MEKKMDKNLKIKLDNCIDTGKEMPVDLDGNTENRWVVYGHCKKIMQEYEEKNQDPLTVEKWAECIDYITKRLGI